MQTENCKFGGFSFRRTLNIGAAPMGETMKTSVHLKKLAQTALSLLLVVTGILSIAVDAYAYNKAYRNMYNILTDKGKSALVLTGASLTESALITAASLTESALIAGTALSESALVAAASLSESALVAGTAIPAAARLVPAASVFCCCAAFPVTLNSLLLSRSGLFLQLRFLHRYSLRLFIRFFPDFSRLRLHSPYS